MIQKKVNFYFNFIVWLHVCLIDSGKYLLPFLLIFHCGFSFVGLSS